MFNGWLWSSLVFLSLDHVMNIALFCLSIDSLILSFFHFLFHFDINPDVSTYYFAYSHSCFILIFIVCHYFQTSLSFHSFLCSVNFISFIYCTVLLLSSFSFCSVFLVYHIDFGHVIKVTHGTGSDDHFRHRLQSLNRTQASTHNLLHCLYIQFIWWVFFCVFL